jgi:hypothetical protein
MPIGLRAKKKASALLDMIVCSLCFIEAKRLHLHAEEINVRRKEASARNRGMHP